MFIKRVQKRHGALKQYSLLSQPLLPQLSSPFQWTHIVLRMSHIRLVPCPRLGQRPLTGHTRQKRTLISFPQLTAAEWMGREVRTLSENTHVRDKGKILVGSPFVHDAFSFSWSRMTHLSQHRRRRSERQKLFFFFFFLWPASYEDGLYINWLFLGFDYFISWADRLFFRLCCHLALSWIRIRTCLTKG